MNILFEGENIKSVEEYREIWKNQGDTMIEKIEHYSQMKFASQEIKAFVYNGKSTSHPLMLRDSYSYNFKKAVLIHELLHILFVDNNLKFKDSLSLHKKLYFFYKDILLDLYGKEFLDYIIEEESKWGEIYKKSWESILH